MNEQPRRDSLSGVGYALAAYAFWGFVPLYFQAVGSVGVWQILAHRVFWGLCLLLVGVLLASRAPELLACFRSRRTALLLALAACLLATNWSVFIWGATHGRVIDTSLGYFINPLFSVLLGVVFLHERLRPAQWLALGIAAAGLVYLTYASGVLPWIGLILATSFGLYGFVRKFVAVDGLVGLTAEMCFLAPAALCGFAYWTGTGTGNFGLDGRISALLMFSGVVTAFPLVCFGQAVRRVRLSTLGFLQYLGPVGQFLLAVLVLKEPFRPEQQISFGLIWVALIVFTLDSLYASFQPRVPTVCPPEDEPFVEGVRSCET